MRKLAMFAGLLLVFTAFTFPNLADQPIDGRSGRAEVRFLEGMMDHHQMALDMANDCLTKTENDALKTLCQNVIDAQTAEIELMQGWLLDWYNIDYQPMPMMSVEEDHTGHQMDNMPFTDPPMMMGMMAGFNRLEGTDYDIAWLESMIDHHDDALHMSERLIDQIGEIGHPELVDLADDIITAQTAEIELMETMLVDLGE